jgi:predicted nucleotidyltransferase
MVIKTIRKKLPAAYVKTAIGKLKEKLIAEGLPVEKVILFGSYAKNRPGIDSDIDVAVILDSNINFDRGKIDRVAWWAKQIDVKLEPHILSENDFGNRWLSLPAEIKKFGTEVK